MLFEHDMATDIFIFQILTEFHAEFHEKCQLENLTVAMFILGKKINQGRVKTRSTLIEPGSIVKIWIELEWIKFNGFEFNWIELN